MMSFVIKLKSLYLSVMDPVFCILDLLHPGLYCAFWTLYFCKFIDLFYLGFQGLVCLLGSLGLQSFVCVPSLGSENFLD